MQAPAPAPAPSASRVQARLQDAEAAAHGQGGLIDDPSMRRRTPAATGRGAAPAPHGRPSVRRSRSSPPCHHPRAVHGGECLARRLSAAWTRRLLTSDRTGHGRRLLRVGWPGRQGQARSPHPGCRDRSGSLVVDAVMAAMCAPSLNWAVQGAIRRGANDAAPAAGRPIERTCRVQRVSPWP